MLIGEMENSDWIAILYMKTEHWSIIKRKWPSMHTYQGDSQNFVSEEFLI